MNTKPLVSIVIVNYNGKHFLPNCLGSLNTIDFPKDNYEIVVVDNASSDGSVKFLEESFPEVKLIKSEENLGFAQGCNLGVKNARGSYIAFLNTDTRVDKNWLKTLVKRIRSDKKIAVVNSKVLLYYPFFELSILSDINPMENFSSSLNFIAVGVLMENAILDNQELQLLLRYRSGFYEKKKGESGFWTRGNAKLLVPFDPTKEEVGITLIVRSEKFSSDTNLSIKLGERKLVSRVMKPYETKKIHIKLKHSALKSHSVFAVQNAGVAIFKTGFGRDRGAVVKGTSQFYEVDNEYYSKPQEVHSFSGASVLLRRDIFDKLGGFDEKFFMYYEDVDLSLRLRRLGWKIYYEPTSRVYHIHSGSSKEWSPFFNYHVEKNYFATLIKHFSLVFFLRQLITYFLKIGLSLIHMVYERMKNDWTTYYEWKEKAQYRERVVKWVLQNFIYFYFKRLSINRTQVLSRQKLNETHY